MKNNYPAYRDLYKFCKRFLKRKHQNHYSTKKMPAFSDEGQE